MNKILGIRDSSTGSEWHREYEMKDKWRIFLNTNDTNFLHKKHNKLKTRLKTDFMHIVSDIEKNNFRHSPDCKENPAMERRSEAEPRNEEL